jgi:septal ring factor EnvC (AmiA/AmiB activator)
VAGEDAGERPAPGLLDQIRRQLERLQNSQIHTERARSDAAQALTEAEKALAATDRELSQNEKSRRMASQALAELEAQRRGTERRVRRHSEERNHWLRAMYYLGPADYLKMLLNQENPRQASTLAGDFQYLVRQRGLEIAEWRSALAELAENGRRIEVRRTELEALGEQHAAARRRSLKIKEERALALAALKQRSESEQGRIEELKRAEQRLAAVVEKLQGASTKAEPAPREVPGPTPRDASQETAGAGLRPDEMQSVMPRRQAEPDRPAPGESSDRLSGLAAGLALPLDLAPVVRFGQPRPPAGLRAQGLVFHADEGAPVRAVARGRVVYADWLRGFGLLLILDHGDGYMSLYGHNRSTDRRVGETVEAGEVIAAVGESGGQERPTLYFEIRHQGRPADPLLWCRAP